MREFNRVPPVGQVDQLGTQPSAFAGKSSLAVPPSQHCPDQLRGDEWGRIERGNAGPDTGANTAMRTNSLPARRACGHQMAKILSRVSWKALPKPPRHLYSIIAQL